MEAISIEYVTFVYGSNDVNMRQPAEFCILVCAVYSYNKSLYCNNHCGGNDKYLSYFALLHTLYIHRFNVLLILETLPLRHTKKFNVSFYIKYV